PHRVHSSGRAAASFGGAMKAWSREWFAAAMMAIAALAGGCRAKEHRFDDTLEIAPRFESRGIDPGPRGGPAAAGGFYPTLGEAERTTFASALAIFKEVASVSGTVPGEPGTGLGPTFNGNSCSLCHAQPAIGGSSPGPKSPQNPV